MLRMMIMMMIRTDGAYKPRGNRELWKMESDQPAGKSRHRFLDLERLTRRFYSLEC